MDYLLDRNATLSNSDLLQQIALLAWLKGGDGGKELFESLTTFRVGHELFQRLSGQRTIDTYRNECIMGIVQYLKTNPSASEADKQREVTKHIEAFAAKVKAM